MASEVLPRRKKKLFLNPLAALKSRKSIVGHYDYLPDVRPEESDDLLLGIEQRQDIADFNIDLEDSDDSDEQDNSPEQDPYYFHTTFDDDLSPPPPQPNVRERHLSALQPGISSYFERSSSPKKRAVVPLRPQDADSDTSGTADTEDESFECNHYTLPKKRTIRFADEEGLAIETVHVHEPDDDDDDNAMRIIVLLLSPKKKRFEFLHLECSYEERTPLSHAYKQFPDMASDHSFQKQHYAGLVRRNGQELINSLALQDYDFKRDEILVAVPSGMKSKHIVQLSQPLLSDKNVLKTVKRKMRNGFALQKLQVSPTEGPAKQSDVPDKSHTNAEDVDTRPKVETTSADATVDDVVKNDGESKLPTEIDESKGPTSVDTPSETETGDMEALGQASSEPVKDDGGNVVESDIVEPDMMVSSIDVDGDVMMESDDIDGDGIMESDDVVDDAVVHSEPAAEKDDDTPRQSAVIDDNAIVDDVPSETADEGASSEEIKPETPPDDDSDHSIEDVPDMDQYLSWRDDTIAPISDVEKQKLAIVVAGVKRLGGGSYETAGEDGGSTRVTVDDVSNVDEAKESGENVSRKPDEKSQKIILQFFLFLLQIMSGGKRVDRKKKGPKKKETMLEV